MIPDLATLRDRAKALSAKILYGMLAMGWRGSARHWHRYETASLLLAGLATPLVVSVHTVVSFDFAAGIVPGWHATIFPPYFVAGAIYAGFAMVLTLAIPLRKIYGLEDFITHEAPRQHGQDHARDEPHRRLRLRGRGVHGCYSGNVYERYMIWNRFDGPVQAHVLGPDLLQRARRRRCSGSAASAATSRSLFVMAMIVNVGMWLERYVIIVVSLHRDFLPSSWGIYNGTVFDWSMFLGSIGLFLALLFLFIRLLPMISIFEMRDDPAGGEGGGGRER